MILSVDREVLSTKKGHRWVRAEGIWAECLDCPERWPMHGDIAPMPECKLSRKLKPLPELKR